MLDIHALQVSLSAIENKLKKVGFDALNTDSVPSTDSVDMSEAITLQRVLDPMSAKRVETCGNRNVSCVVSFSYA